MKDKIDEGDDSKDDGETKDKEQLQQKEHDSTQNLMNYWLKNSEQLLAIYKKVMASKIDNESDTKENKSDKGDDSKEDSETKKSENSNVDGRKKSIDVEIREPNREIKKDKSNITEESQKSDTIIRNTIIITKESDNNNVDGRKENIDAKVRKNNREIKKGKSEITEESHMKKYGQVNKLFHKGYNTFDDMDNYNNEKNYQKPNEHSDQVIESDKSIQKQPVLKARSAVWKMARSKSEAANSKDFGQEDDKVMKLIKKINGEVSNKNSEEANSKDSGQEDNEEITKILRKIGYGIGGQDNEKVPELSRSNKMVGEEETNQCNSPSGRKKAGHSPFDFLTDFYCKFKEFLQESSDGVGRLRRHMRQGMFNSK